MSSGHVKRLPSFLHFTRTTCILINIKVFYRVGVFLWRTDPVLPMNRLVQSGQNNSSLIFFSATNGQTACVRSVLWHKSCAWRVELFSEASQEGNIVHAMLNYIGKFELVSMQCIRVMVLWCNELVYGCHPVWFKSKTKRQKRLKFVLRKSDFQSFEVLRYAYSKKSQS